MCEHTRRPKLFCTLQSCPHPSCCGCSTCLKSLHSHSGDNFIDERQIAYLLTRFDPPTTFKQERKNTTVKMYKFLTKLKGEISIKLEEMIVELMSKVKYPYLHHMQLLESYRNVRDKNYQRLNPNKFRAFCKAAKNLSGSDFLDKEKQYYSQYLQESHDALKGFGQSIRIVERAFGFQLPLDLLKMHEEFMKEVDDFKKLHKVSKSLEKRDFSFTRANNPLNSSVKLQKKPIDFLTPTKPTISLDVSLDNLSFNSDPKLRKKSENLGDYNCAGMLSLDLPSQQMKRVNTTEDQKRLQLRTPHDNDSKTVKSSGDNKLNGQLEQSPIRMIPRLNVSELRNYDDDLDTMRIRVSDARTQNQNSSKTIQCDNSLNNSIDFSLRARKDDLIKKVSYHEQMLTMGMKDRQQKIKNRLGDLKKEKISDANLTFKDPFRFKKEAEIATKKLSETTTTRKSPSKTNIQKGKQTSGLTSSVSIDKKLSFSGIKPKSPTKSPKKHPQIALIESKLEAKNTALASAQSRKSPKKTNNVSLNKQFHYQSEKSNENINLHFKNFTKQIPIEPLKEEPPKKRKLLKKNSFLITQEEELQAACILTVKLKQLKSVQKKVEYLEKYVQKYQNCLSAVEYLSFMYLDIGKIKQCLNLTTSYLDKLDILTVSEIQKVNLVVNRSAALNQLGRYSQTVSFLKTKLDIVDNDKLHKNMGDALFNLGTTDRAIYHFEKATKLNDKYDEAYYNLAVILYLQESYFNAKMNINKALRSQKANPAYLQLLAAINGRISNDHQG